MTTDADSRPEPKPPRRPARTPRPAPAPAPTTVGLQLKLPPDVVQRIKVEALGRGMTVSQLVTELVTSRPAEWVLSRRGPRLAQVEADDEARRLG